MILTAHVRGTGGCNRRLLGCLNEYWVYNNTGNLELVFFAIMYIVLILVLAVCCILSFTCLLKKLNFCPKKSCYMFLILQQVDGMDALAVKQACRFAKEHALKNGPIVSFYLSCCLNFLLFKNLLYNYHCCRLHHLCSKSTSCHFDFHILQVALFCFYLISLIGK